MVLVPERHPLAEGDRVPIDALRTEPFIELNPGLETDNSRFFAKYDLHPNTRFTTSDPTAVRSIVSAGLGISLINDLQAGTEKNGIRILPTDPEELVSICLVTPLTPSPAARRFLDFAQAHLSELT